MFAVFIRYETMHVLGLCRRDRFLTVYITHINVVCIDKVTLIVNQNRTLKYQSSVEINCFTVHLRMYCIYILLSLPGYWPVTACTQLNTATIFIPHVARIPA
jgi:hypothetical protein